MYILTKYPCTFYERNNAHYLVCYKLEARIETQCKSVGCILLREERRRS